ncbi:MAG: hypothetical protein GQ574_19360 [Crocinitomix sp.]|nr:hypothetical protein [Crocinitomix sp.]
MKTLFIILSLIGYSNQEKSEKEVSKNEMSVSWEHKDARVYFKMAAPTTGWITIGFNTTSGMSKAYLLMGRVINGNAEVVEHYTSSPGNYKTLIALGVQISVYNIAGTEANNQTTLEFSIPIQAKNKFARDLTKGSEYVMTLAYSQEDDFQHHSTMRTSINVKI